MRSIGLIFFPTRMASCVNFEDFASSLKLGYFYLKPNSNIFLGLILFSQLTLVYLLIRLGLLPHCSDYHSFSVRIDRWLGNPIFFRSLFSEASSLSVIAKKKKKKTNKACLWHSAPTQGSDERFATATKTHPRSPRTLLSPASPAATQILVPSLLLKIKLSCRWYTCFGLVIINQDLYLFQWLDR